MKTVLLCFFVMILSNTLFAQKIVEKTFKVTKDQPVLLMFDFPKIKVSSWNKDEIYIKATVNINESKQNELFTLLDKSVDGKLIVTDSIDFKNLESQYYVESNGVKKHFETKEDFENYKKEHKGDRISSYSSTNNIDVQIELILPVKDYITMKSKFGWVEIDNYAGPLVVQTEFGKLDVRLKESNVGKIKLTNHFGKIYSDFNLNPTEKEERNFYTSLTASPGKGPAYELSSKFGNIYLRNAL